MWSHWTLIIPIFLFQDDRKKVSEKVKKQTDLCNWFMKMLLQFDNVCSLYHISILGSLHYNFQRHQVRIQTMFCINDGTRVWFGWFFNTFLSFVQVVDHLVNSLHSCCTRGRHVPLLHVGAQILLNSCKLCHRYVSCLEALTCLSEWVSKINSCSSSLLYFPLNWLFGKAPKLIGSCPLIYCCFFSSKIRVILVTLSVISLSCFFF